MTNPLRVRGLALVLALGVTLTAASREADDPAAMHAQLKQIADDLAAGKDISKAAADFAKKYDNETAMSAFKPTDAKPPGIGAGKVFDEDGIEATWDTIGKKGLSAEKMKAKAKELKQAVEITAVFYEITKHHAPEDAKKKKQWNDFNDAFQKATKDVAEAIKKEDPDKLKAASNKLIGKCNDCHGIFR